jgi:phage-related tail protein
MSLRSERSSLARKLDEVIQLNSDFAKLTFDEFTAEVTKIGSIYADVANQTLRVAKESAKPLAEAASAAKAASQRKPEPAPESSN